MKSFISKLAAAIILVAFPVIVYGQWVGPTLAPPNGNASTPLNLSSNPQSKTGQLNVNTGGAATGFTVPYGNVGIGTVAPGAKLEVAGQIKITGGTPGAGKVLTSDATGLASWTTIGGGTIGGSGTTNYLSKFTAASTLGNSLIFDNGTNVGIGTASPSSKLEVSGLSRFNSGAQYSAINTGFSSSHGYSTGNWGVRLGATGSVGVVQAAQDSTAYTLSLNPYGGNVGVGTVSPAYKLDVSGDLLVQGWMRTSGNTGWYSNTHGGGWYMTDTSWIRSYGEKGIWLGTGTIGSNGSLSVGYGGTGGPSGGAIISGNVGIGTASPGAKLHVSGGATNLSGYGIDNWFPYTNGANYLRGTTYFNGVLYDESNTGYYLDPASTSNLNVVNIVGGGTHDGIHYFRANKGAASYVGGQVNYAIQAYSSDGGAAGMSFHRGGAYAVNIGLDPDNVFRIGGWSAAANRLQLDMSGNLTLAGSVYAPAFYYSSDKELKKNIEPLKDSLAKVLKLEGVSFDWKETGRSSVGVIAQDVEKVYPELVSTDEKTGLKSVEYGNLVAPLIEAVKEQQKQIDELKAEVRELKSKNK